MTVFFVLVGIAVYAAVYLAVGWRLAIRDIPNARRRAAEQWEFEEIIDGSVKEQTLCTVLLWPVLIPLRLLDSKLDQAIADHDPTWLRREIGKRDQRIADLERELGLDEPAQQGDKR